MTNPNVLEMKGITKCFPGVKALDQMDFSLRKGEIHALVGENGAGKSTLMKILSGVFLQDSGDIIIEGKKLIFKNTKQAEESGISIIYQDLKTCDNLSVADNVFAGREYKKGIFLDENRIATETKAVLNQFEIYDLDVNTQVGDLSVAGKQIVEIAKAVSKSCKVIIMDEPTSSLAMKETEKLFKLIRFLKEKGTSIIYISHRLEEIFGLADRVTVLRDGKHIGTRNVCDVNKDEIITMMIGRTMERKYPESVERSNTNQRILEIEGLTNKYVKDISFHLYKGEILGISGLVGSGRTELAKTIYGKYKKDQGKVKVEGHTVSIKSPIDAIKQGIVLVTEDRKDEGLVLGLSVKDNITAGNIRKVCNRVGFVNKEKEANLCNEGIEGLHIITPSCNQIVKNLSGGNQQKVILAKWLASNPKIIILDEPTRGIDVGAKYEIYTIMRRLQKEGVSIIMISSELPEILGMSDRVAVMRSGEMVAILENEDINQNTIMNYSIGGYKDEQ